MNALVSALLLVNALVALALGAIGLARRRTPGGLPLGVMMFAVAAWSLINVGQISALHPDVKRGFAQAAYVFIVGAVVCWWWCCAEYSGRGRWVSRGRLLLVAAPGAVSLGLVAAGGRTTLMWTSLVVQSGPGPVSFPPGPWFLVHSVWAFSLVLGGFALVARTMLRAPRAYRSQLPVFLLAVLAPLLVNTGTVQTGLIDTRGHDFTPIALLASAVVLGFGVMRFGLLDLAVGVVPEAHDSVVAAMRDGIVIVGEDGRVIGANPSADTVLGPDTTFCIGVPVAAALPAWRPGATTEVRVGTGSEQRVIEVSSAPLGPRRGHVITLRDVTAARTAERVLRDSYERASHQAKHDHLTGLPNRRFLFEALKRQTGPFALFILDLDGFKAINDLHGHGAGDDILSQLAVRLRAACRPDSVVARLGGDEFAVLIPGALQRAAESAAHVAVDAVSAPLAVDGHDVLLTASVGVALAPQHGANSDELVRAADVAMYSAKRSRKRVAMYGDVDDARSRSRVQAVSDLRRAFGHGELICHYQPQVRSDGSVRGVEALVRWQHPERGLLRPASFLKTAKQGGLMCQLSDVVLATATRDLHSWVTSGRDWLVSVNLDADDLVDPTLVRRVEGALSRSGVPARRLTVEVTESAAFDTADGARVLEGLRRLGVSVALDDFGTGYGPLSHLRQLPVDELKLDQSFVSGLMRDRRDAALVAGQIRLGHDLGLVVVGEGVEDAACATRLLELQCDVLQGFHVGAPVPAASLVASLHQTV